MEVKCGEEHPYPWPKIKSVFSPSDKIDFMAMVEENPECCISEKLDGSNLCVADQWIASRRIVIARKSDNLFNKTFNNMSLAWFQSFYAKFEKLRVWMQRQVGADAELLLFGEFILNGTASCKSDIYNYKRKCYKPGQFYVFGLGVAMDTKPESPLFASHMALTNKNGKPYYIVPLNLALEELLDEFDIDHVTILDTDNFVCLLGNATEGAHLMERECEGYVISRGADMWKWKYIEDVQSHHIQYNNELQVKYGTGNKYLFNMLDNLSSILKSATTYTMLKEFKNLFDSAASKYPCISDLFHNFDTKEHLKNEVKKYRENIWAEMLEDMHSDGMRVDAKVKENLRTQLERHIKHLYSDHQKTVSHKTCLAIH